MTPEIYESLFKGKKILVVGDLMLDRYVTGRVERTSPEAPVPVLTYDTVEDKAGGAANCALNIWSLGGEAAIIGHLGNDEEGASLKRILNDKGIKMVLADGEDNRPTTLKTRFMAGKQHLLRLDREELSPMSEEWSESIQSKTKHFIDTWRPQAVLLQDYNKGVLSPSFVVEVIRICNAMSIPIIVDPKKDNIPCFDGCTIFKPNLRELGSMTGRDVPPDVQELSKACDELQSLFSHSITVVTLGEHGVFFKERAKQGQLVRPLEIKVADVCGAGDIFASVLAMGMGAGVEILKVVALANELSARSCEKSGVVLAELSMIND